MNDAHVHAQLQADEVVALAAEAEFAVEAEVEAHRDDHTASAALPANAAEGNQQESSLASLEAEQQEHSSAAATMELLGDTTFEHMNVSKGSSTPVTPMINRPSTKDIVEFGGIEDPSVIGLRYSARIRSQPNSDAPQMERAMTLAQQRDDFSPAGCSPRYLLDSPLVLPPSVGATSPYGYWMYPSYGGRPSYLVPAWLAAF